MSLAAAQRYAAPHEENDAPDVKGAQTLLHLQAPRPNHPARIGAALAYFALLGAIVTVGFRTNVAPVEEEQAIELAPLAAEEPPPEEDTPQPPEEIELPLPPPLAMDPIAPVEQKTPVEKPKLKPEKKIEKRVQQPSRARPAPTRAQNVPRVAAPAVRAPAAPPGASTSAIANQFHACMQRAAANAYPESQAPRSAHISYHASFSASGALSSYTISPSGIGAFDAVAQRLGGRCSSVAAPGKPVSLSGALTFSP
jgi:periplasmic protein TonB